MAKYILCLKVENILYLCLVFPYNWEKEKLYTFPSQRRKDMKSFIFLNIDTVHSGYRLQANSVVTINTPTTTITQQQHLTHLTVIYVVMIPY